MSVRIIVDSTADLSQACAERVKAVPLTVHFGDEEYLDGVTITAEQFYKKLLTAKDLPTTSQATPFAFSEAFEEAVEAGDDVVAIIASSALTGTYQSAVIAASEFEGRVFVVDSLQIALSSGIMVKYALQLVDQGMSAEAIAEELNRIRGKVHLMAVVDTLEYLQRGGRVSRAVAIAGGLLSIKPIIATSPEGKIEVIGKARGNKQANAMMNKKAQELNIDFTKPVMVGFTGTEDTLLQKYLVESENFFSGNGFDRSIVGAVVGTHAGPNAVALAFFSR